MQNNQLSTLKEVSNYRSSNTGAYLIIDTNILLLFLVGVYDPEYLKDCSLMKDNGKFYGKEHFELMKKILDIFLYRIAITPHILSEVNMLSQNIKPPKFEKYFEKVIQQFKKVTEEHIEMLVLLNNRAIVNFGFTDISLIEVADRKKWVVLTDDFNLQKTFRGNIPIIYFSNIVANDMLLV